MLLQTPCSHADVKVRGVIKKKGKRVLDGNCCSKTVVASQSDLGFRSVDDYHWFRIWGVGLRVVGTGACNAGVVRDMSPV